MRVLRFLLAWAIALSLVVARWTCRFHWHNDPRPSLRADKRPYAYAIAHCHQVAAVIGSEKGTGAMISRSVDGDLLVPSMRLNGVTPVRGSSRSKGQDKGGAAALDKLIEHVRGGLPAYLAVDGPRGPRGFVNRGIAKLAMATNAAVIVAAPIPRWRWILTGTWDRFQIPKFFSRIDVHFWEPLVAEDGESLEDFRLRIEDAMRMLEERHDPAEAALGRIAATKRRERLKREALAA